jgi:CheY-like chemotaxis protein
MSTDLDDAIPAVAVDGKRIMQVLVSLLNNAIRATPDGGRVGIRARVETDSVRVDVWDTGAGIDPENPLHALPPLERVQYPSPSSLDADPGLGLALSQQLVELHGGTLGVAAAQDNQGALVWFTLPLPSAAPPILTRPVFQVLLVEDDPDDSWLIQRAFREIDRPRCNLHVVEDGLAALDFLWQREQYTKVPKPDLILLDLKLPKKDGREVLTEIKADARLKPIPLVVLTSSTDDEDVVRSYELSANAYVQKPILAPFTKVIRQIVDFWLTTSRLPPDSPGGAPEPGS